MKIKYFILLLIISLSCKSKKENYTELKKELTEIYLIDQIDRNDKNWILQIRRDEQNLIAVTKIIDSLGWLSKEEIGDTANAALFLVIQHSNKATMEKYFPILKKAVENKKANKQDLALLTDRIEMLNGRPQIYGSQFQTINNELVLYPILDSMNVHKRRKEIGMKSLEE